MNTQDLHNPVGFWSGIGLANGHLEKESCATNRYWLPCVDIGTFKMSTATISQGLQAITGCKGAGLFLGALAIWHFAQRPQ